MKKNKIATFRKLFLFFILFSIMLASLSLGNITNATAQNDQPPSSTATPPSEPGDDVTGQIIGGAPADAGEWPWQVALVSHSQANLWNGQFCGGSLIHPLWVVTAAHCVEGASASDIDVAAGVYDLWNPAAGYQRRLVTQIIVHPDYDADTYESDIALLRLSSMVTLGGSGATKTATVPLVSSTVGSLSGVNSWVTGWGNTNTQASPVYPDQLYEVQLPIYANSVCNNASHYNGDISSNMLCAGFDIGGKDSCQGDSGGPLVVSVNSQWQLAGVVSWGNGCATPNFPGVYTRVSNFSDWVHGYVPAVPDIYEPDNNSGQASWIYSGTPQVHSISATADSDWAKFELTGTSAVLLRTSGSSSDDTQMWLYDSSLNQLDYNDDDELLSYSQIDRICNVDSLPAGTYYVRVQEFGDNNEIITYNLSVQSSICPSASLDAYVASDKYGSYLLGSGESQRISYVGLNDGPVLIDSNLDVVSSIRVLYKGKSYSEMLGFPVNQLTNEYWYPVYDSATLNSQLRVGNLGSESTNITVYLGNGEVLESFTLGVDEAVRKNYSGENGGPLRVVSSATNILVSMRLLYGDSYTEELGYPANQLTNDYWFPWYNNTAFPSELRVANTGDVEANVTVYIGDNVVLDTFSLDVGESLRKSYPSTNNGPLRVVSSTSTVLPSIRVLYKGLSYSEMLGLPNSKLTNEYWLPAYDSSTVNSQLRFGNVGGVDTTVTVYIADGQVLETFSLDAGDAVRKNYAGVDDGPLHIVSSASDILVTNRILMTTTGFESYYELLAYPDASLAAELWFPWYNNSAFPSQLRIAVP